MRIHLPTPEEIATFGHTPMPGSRVPRVIVRHRPERRHVHKLKLTGGVFARYKVMVIDAKTKRVVHERPWARNLILDQGLNSWCNGTLTGFLFTNCAVGTGSTPTVRDSSGVATLTVVGTNCTASAAFFEAADVGRLLKLDSGGEAYISNFNSTTDVDLATAPGDSGPEDGAVWYVDETGLASESKRTASYLTGVGNCGTTMVSNVATMRRTFDFSAEVANQNYTELGWSPSGTPGTNLVSRTLIAGGSVSVLIGQQLRVVYDWNITLTPNVSTPGATTVTGWPVAPATTQDGDFIIGDHRILNSFPGLRTVATSGATITTNTGDGLEPSDPPIGTDWYLSTVSVLPAFGADGNLTSGTFAQGNSASIDAYVAGTFARTKRYNYNLSTGNATNWRSIGLSTGGMFMFVWDEAQTKANTHTLEIALTWQMGRTLVNP